MLSYKMAYEAARIRQQQAWQAMEEVQREANLAAPKWDGLGNPMWRNEYRAQYRAAQAEWERACHATERARLALKARAGTF